MQTNLYPKGPAVVPIDFTTPGKAYKKHVLIASGALILFMFLYLGLSTWFLHTSYRLFVNSFTGKDGFLSFVVAVVIGFLGVFMFKALFFISKKDKNDDIEITKEDEPQLFEFIYKVADDARAPRPHKVFLSNTVNACVFYDISIINLIFPTKKNLEIGLGLVNTLNLGEFKSILAHEFGHFTQRSMIIGRWVYIAHKVAYQIVSKRDGFDTFLSGLSRVDLRVAWVGWLLSIIVWSIRSISETFFKLVLITQRALSREMEFHADLVAVFLTGSDALIHSLYKLNAADEAYDEAIRFVNKQLKNKKAVSDVFSIQSNSIKHMAVVLSNPAYGVSPKLPFTDGAKFKVFKEQIAQAPKMWSTHPSNIDRERNAKKNYIKSEVDERSSWLLFKDADKTKNKITLSLYKNLKIETTPLANQDSIELHDKEFQRSFLLPKYKGAYLNRSVLISFKSVNDIYNTNIESTDLTSQFSLLYPETLQKELEHLKNLDEEIEMLEGLNNKVLDANEGRINYRDREISRKDLPSVIDKAQKEAKLARNKINEHDKLCRNVHYAAAKKIGKGWGEYLFSITNLIHYCEHTQRNIEALSRFYYQTLAETTKIRNIGYSEMVPLLNAANDLHFAIEGVFTYGRSIKLSSQIIDKLDGKQFDEFLQPFELGKATQPNINSWIGVVDSWTNLALSALNTLREAALDELLLMEEYIQKTTLTSAIAVEQAPEPIGISDLYSKFDPNTKREVIVKADILSRFYSADGILPTIGRLAVAASIIIFAVFFSSTIGNSSLVVFNGLPIDLIVRVDGKSINVRHNESSEIEVDNSKKLNIETTTIAGEPIESFTPQLSDYSKTYVYNIAGGAMIYEWFAIYGGYGMPANNSILLGAQRWIEVTADYYFEEPPESISLKAGQSASKGIVSFYNAHPAEIANVISSEEDRNNFITIHALWEKSTSPHINTWLALACNLKTFSQILNKRLTADPFEVASLRMQQEFYKGDEKLKICEQQRQMYLKNQDNPNLYYIKTRCIENEIEKNTAFIEGHNKWPENPWLAYASGHTYIQREDWRNALSCFKTVHEKAPDLREVVLEEMKRIYHLMNEDSLMVQLNDVQLPYLRYVQAVENSFEHNSEDRFYAYKLLEQGKIQEAIKYSISDNSVHSTILRLAAVSDGANEEVIAKALTLPATQETSYAELMPALALSAKRNVSLEIYRDLLKNIAGEHVDTLFKFIDHVKSNKIVEADKLLASMTAEMKGKTSLIGVILLGNKAPLKWSLFVSGLLFINEKPYLKRRYS
ncbi:MAG: M48 family metallopeptidase [Bacteroidota bacterium]